MTKKNIWRRLYEWDPVGPGKLLDWTTYRGCFRALGFWIVMTYAMWYSYEMFHWFDRLVGFEPVPIDPGKQSWSRVWAVIIGGSGILTSIVAMIRLPINRRRTRKSAEGQWFDRPDLTREELYEKAPEPFPEPERNVKPEIPEPDGYWKEESTPTHLIVESAVPKSTAGNLRLERHAGRSVLIVPSSKDE